MNIIGFGKTDGVLSAGDVRARQLAKQALRQRNLPGIASSRRRIVVGVAVIHLLPHFITRDKSELCYA